MKNVYKVTAVIVTYNRINWLKKVYDSLLSQSYPLHKIAIVDNCSTDETEAWTEQFDNSDQVLIHRTQENLGGAGGFSKGIEIAMSYGSDFVWIMDDDCLARPEALNKLIYSWDWFRKNKEWVPGFLCSLVKFQDTDDICEMNIPQTVWDWPRHVNEDFPGILVKSCSFVSALVPAEKIRQVGLPHSEYFIWYDDAEYTKRLSKDYPGLLVLDSVVEHHTPVNRGVNFSDVNDANLWKFKYGARNEASYRYHTDGIASWKDFVVRVNRQMHEGKVSLENRLRINECMVKGIKFNPQVKYI